MQGADALRAYGFNQAQGLAMLTRLRYHQACAGQQRPKELPHRHVKTERGFLQHRVVSGQTIRLLHPAQAVDQGRVGVACAFGATGRAGGVNHIRKVLWVLGDAQVAVAVTVKPVGVLIQREHIDARHGQRLQQRTLGQQQRDAAVFDHVGQTLLRVLRVQRHISAPSLKNRQQAKHHVDRALNCDPHQHIRGHPVFAQPVSKLVGSSIQLRVRQRLRPHHQRGCSWRARHLRLDQLLQAGMGRVGLLGTVPIMHLRLQFAGVEHGQLADTAFGVVHQRTQ